MPAAVVPSAIIHMGARFKDAMRSRDKVPEPTIAVSDGEPRSQYRLANEIDILDKAGHVVATIKSRVTKAREIAGHDVHCWVEVYGARLEMR